MWASRGHSEFTISDIKVNLEDYEGKSMADFDDTFNMFIGISDKEFDWFDNPYLQANVYHFDDGLRPKLARNITLEKCGD